MKTLLSFTLCFILAMLAEAQTVTTVDYQQTDSVRVEKLLGKAAGLKRGTNLMIYFARQLRGVPYVAQTLEHNDTERLVVNLRQLDCTTYVETVTALTLCARRGERSFSHYCRQLQALRYERGEISYPRRLHYFTTWIADNTAKGLVKEVSAPNPPFTAVQQVAVGYMTRHADRYPMLVAHPEWVQEIAAAEQAINGKRYPYIPKRAIANTALYRQTIHSGDIIAIITSKAGLDTSHVGIAVWHKDGLHLLNASQIHGKVVEEPMTLCTYMSKHPSQVGIRIVRLCPAK